MEFIFEIEELILFVGELTLVLVVSAVFLQCVCVFNKKVLRHDN